MVNVTVGMGDGVYALRAVGHATGSPEMCAAVSGLLYALAGYLVNAQTFGRAVRQIDEMGGGDTHLQYAGGEGVRAAYETAYIGLKQLEKAGPEYVRVELACGHGMPAF